MPARGDSEGTVDGWAGVRFGRPEVGAVSERTKTTSARDVELFTELTGDANPLHVDEEAATASRFGARIVQGGVITGILNALVAEELPGPGTVFLSVEWNFRHPIYVGDTMTGRVEVLEVRPDKPICRLKTTVHNQNGELCLDGAASTYTVALDPRSQRDGGARNRSPEGSSTRSSLHRPPGGRGRACSPSDARRCS